MGRKHTVNIRDSLLIIALLSLLSACGGGGGDSETPPQNPGTVDLSIAATSAAEDAGSLAFTVSRSGGSDGVVDVQVNVTGGTADPANDFSISGNLIQFGDGDAAAKSGAIQITDDALVETDETVLLELVVVSGGATLGTATASLTITDNDGVAPNPGTVDLSLVSSTIAEDAGGINFSVSRSGGSDGVVDVQVSVVGGTADPANDFSINGNIIQFADGDSDAKIGDILVTDDSLVEANETIQLELTVVSGGATLGISTATLTITDNDTPPPPSGPGYGLNDTGVTLCVDSFGAEFACDAPEVSAHPGQDAGGGRDVSEPSDSDGHAGFVFSKLDGAGLPLADQSVNYATTTWDCVEDHTTGLVWEVKTRDGGLRDAAHTYRWHERQRGEGPAETGPPQCSGLSDCEVAAYVDAVNAAGLCGRNNWRVPSRSELLSIVDFGSRTIAAIDEGFFPNTEIYPFWSSTRQTLSKSILFVEFDEGVSFAIEPANALRIRLVSGGM
ncbi:MAG: DUF1566 domain-containing protein [Candidatus Thiodiazotropha sp.]